MICAVLGALILGATVHAQDAGSNAGQLWKEAQRAFGTSDYALAANSLQNIIKNYPVTGDDAGKEAPANRQWLEPVFFMLGAAKFDAKDWSGAIATFTRYRTLFPRSPRFIQSTSVLAQAELLGGHPDDALTLFVAVAQIPEFHEKTIMLMIEAYKQTGRLSDAAALLESDRAKTDLTPGFRQKVNMRLSHLYLDMKEEGKDSDLLREMDANIKYVPDVAEFNGLAIKLGDLLLSKGKTEQALACYRKVRDNEQLLALEQQQIENLCQQRDANLARIQADPLNSSLLQLDNKDVDAQIVHAHGILAQYKNMPPILPPLYLRIGRAFFSDGDLWEAATVYRALMRRYPHCAEVEPSLYACIILFDQLKQTDRAISLCEDYLKQFPDGKYADSVGFLRGVLAFDAQDYDRATAYFKQMLSNSPNTPRREQIEMILGDIQLRQQKFEDAVACYKKYESDFPQGHLREQAEYRTGLALLFGGKHDEADQAIRAYLQHHPDGTYAADAEYRLAVIKFGNKDYSGAIADAIAWEKKYPEAPPLAEVFSLLGDCYASQDKNEEAVKSYIASYKKAQSLEVLSYSIMAAAKILQKQAKWADVAAMFQEFVKNNPDHPLVVTALSWIGRADVKLGKVERGKQFLASAAKQYLDDPSREAVDEIITQLAQLYVRKHFNPLPAPTTAQTVGAGTNAAAAIAPPPAPEDPAAELQEALTIDNLDAKPTARARILFAASEVARLQRKPDVEAQFLLKIADDFKPEDLSPILSGQVGDCLLQNGKPDKAEPIYYHLMDDYDQSLVDDYAYNGLGQIAYDQMDYFKALRFYSKALDKGLAASKLKDITLGEAQTFLALNRPLDAKPLFEQVAGTRAWRGEATALSVYSLGEIQMDLGKYPEANAYYQRVFVAYQKFPAIQAKAYLKSGEAFEKMGKIPEAINTYTEMLRNTNLLAYPEVADARQRLQQLGSR